MRRMTTPLHRHVVIHPLLVLTMLMLCSGLHSLLSIRGNYFCGGRGRMMITTTPPPPHLSLSLLVFGPLHRRMASSTTGGDDSYTHSGRDRMQLFSSSSTKYNHGSNSNSNRNKNNDAQHSSSRNTNNAKSGRTSPNSAIEVRLNKCIHSLSRRAADDAITAGLVTVNNVVAVSGCKVKLGDKVRYKNVLQSWEEKAVAVQDWSPSEVLEDRDFIYLKYWKPVGITCTADLRDPTNILMAGKFNLLPQRVFTVGRLDKDSSGLILLTSDGRVNDAMLNKRDKKEKVYQVEMNKTPSDDQLAEMSRGVEITTPLQRDNSEEKLITAKTLPCYVKRIKSSSSSSSSSSKTQQDPLSTREGSSSSSSSSRKVEFTLIEGRNRQIRRMAEAVGLEVVALHRISFAGIRLKGLSQGNWCELTSSEMKIVQDALLQNKVKSAGQSRSADRRPNE